MRSIWKGAITFGLVNVPVKLYSATENHDVALHMVHDEDGGRIRYQRRCEVCGRIIDYSDIDRAYDDGEHRVVLTDDDFESLPEQRSREIEVVEFVPAEQVDPLLFDTSYYLEPDGNSVKAYTLLRRTLEGADRIAIARFALRQKSHLAALRVRGRTMVLQTMRWSDELREPEFPALQERAPRVSSRELEMSAQLVESFSANFRPDRFTDEYQEQLRELIDRKLETGEALPVDEEAAPEGDGEVLDLMEALRRSVEQNRSTGGTRGKRGA